MWLGTRGSDVNDGWDDGANAGWSLVGLLVLIAAIVLLFTGRYPKPIYDFLMGMDRWALRVGPYVALMTDRFPPFRLDTGGPDLDWMPAGPIPPSSFGGRSARLHFSGSSR